MQCTTLVLVRWSTGAASTTWGRLAAGQADATTTRLYDHGATTTVGSRASGSRQEVSENLLRIPHADLDVIELSNAGVGVQRLALDEEGSHGIGREQLLFVSELMQRLEHCAVELAGSELSAGILRERLPGFSEDFNEP